MSARSVEKESSMPLFGLYRIDWILSVDGSVDEKSGGVEDGYADLGCDGGDDCGKHVEGGSAREGGMLYMV